MPKKTEVPNGVVNCAQCYEEIAEEIQAQMPKKTEVPDGVANSAQSCEEIAEEIQAQMLKKTEVLTDVVLDHSGSNQLEGRGRAPDGLLDSGASHPMRSATSVEYSGGSPVSVTLAGEGVRVLRQNDQGTILVEKEQGQVQPIVPLGALIQDLGYTLHWGPSFLKLTHPTKGPVKVRINNNCPEVAACDALAMIRELEMSQVKLFEPARGNVKGTLGGVEAGGEEALDRAVEGVCGHREKRSPSKDLDELPHHERSSHRSALVDVGRLQCGRWKCLPEGVTLNQEEKEGPDEFKQLGREPVHGGQRYEGPIPNDPDGRQDCP